MFDPLSLPLSEKGENPSKDLNFSSTNQTSVEVSIDEFLNQTNENFSNFTEEVKGSKGCREKTFRPLSEPKKLMNGQSRHYRYTQTSHKSVQRPSSVEKYKTNSSFEVKNPRKSGGRNEKPFKSQFLEAGRLNFQNKLKIKQFTPVLSGKRVKVTRPEVKETRSEAKVVNLNELIDRSLNIENFRKTEKTGSVPLIPQPLKHMSSSKAFPTTPSQIIPTRSSEVFFSPLRNIQNFQPLSKVSENPYSNFELSPDLTSILEDLKKNILLSESESEEGQDLNDSERLAHLDYFDHLDQLDKLDQLEKIYSYQPSAKSRVREPSFGFGGGEFAYQELPKTEEAIYYDPRISESEKNVQTDEQTGLKNMLSMVTNDEFINSLKIIGKFASFIESNLVVN
jgi:hypothetical protein